MLRVIVKVEQGELPEPPLRKESSAFLQSGERQSLRTSVSREYAIGVRHAYLYRCRPIVLFLTGDRTAILSLHPTEVFPCTST